MNAYMSTSTTTYERDQREPAPTMPWDGTSDEVQATFVATAAIVAGKLNSVRPVRPRITTIAR